MKIRHNPLSGGYCGGVPPLPIPNREVKPTCADGTAMQCGRVGRRLLSMKSLRFRKISEAFLFFLPADLFLLRWFFLLAEYSLSRRFRRWRRFFLIDYLSPTDFTDLHRFFLIDYFSPTDFTDLRRFFSLIIFLMDLHGFSLVLFFSVSFFISQILDLSVWEDDADFCSHELEKDYADFSNSLFFLFWIHWFLYIINLLIRHFSDPYFLPVSFYFPIFLPVSSCKFNISYKTKLKLRFICGIHFLLLLLQSKIT